MSSVAIERNDESHVDMTNPSSRIDDILQSIEKRAFALFEEAGSVGGDALKHWLQAENEILETPKAELSDTRDSVILRIALPGFKPSEIQICAWPQMVDIHASHKDGKDAINSHVQWSEFANKAVFRRFSLPFNIAVSSTAAKLDLGILTITAEKTDRTLASSESRTAPRVQ